MSIAYPTIFPSPLLGPYKYSRQSGVHRTDMSSGSARQRRVFRDQIWRGLNLSWNMSGDELAAWEGWLDHVANGGAEWISMTILNGTGLATAEIRFDGKYDILPIRNDLFSVKIVAEARSMQAYGASLASYASSVSTLRPYFLVDRGYGVTAAGGNVSDWADQSLRNNDLSQSVSGDRPANHADGPQFDESNGEHIYTANSPILPSSGDFVVGVRFKTGTLVADDQVIIGFNNSSDTDVWKMWCGIDSAGDLHFFQADAINGDIDTDVVTGLSNDTWYSLIISKDDADSNFQIMLDTAASATTVGSATPSSFSQSPLVLGGKFPTDTADNFEGNIAVAVVSHEAMSGNSTKALALMAWLNAFI